MSHMVIFQTADGNPGYNQFESVNEAVSFVETLRNEQGIENARMFALEEIKFELKPYYKVELQMLNAGAPAPKAAPAPAAPAPAPAQPAPASPSATPGSGEPTTFGTFAPPAGAAPAPAAPAPTPAAPAPTPPADEPSADSQPTRRGLFGR